VCVIFNSVRLDASREVKRDITIATGCLRVGGACCRVSGGVSSSWVSVVFICSIFRVLTVMLQTIAHDIRQWREYVFPKEKWY